MTTDLIHDPVGGPIIAGTRLTVYNLLTYFLDPTATEAYICKLYDLTPEQVAAARAYVLNNPETVLARHLEIEAQMGAGNAPEVVERAKQTNATLLKFKDWLIERQRAEARENADASARESGKNGSGRFPRFREWFAEQTSRTRSCAGYRQT